MPSEKPKIKAGAGTELGASLGYGMEKRIYEHKNNSDRVIGVYHPGYKRKPEVTKARYYLMNILHMLHPKYFRAVRQVGHEQVDRSGNEKTSNYIVMDNLQMSADHKRITELRRKGATDEVREIDVRLRSDPQYLDFIQIMQDVGLGNSFYSVGGIDMTTENFSKDPEGNLKYIDTIDAFADTNVVNQYYVVMAFDKAKLRHQIETKLSGSEQTRAFELP